MPVPSHLVLSLRSFNNTPNYKHVFHSSRIWLYLVSLVNIYRIMFSIFGSWYYHEVRGLQTMSLLKKASSCFSCTLDCVVLACVDFICKGCWPLPFCCLSSSQRSCDIFWCWSACRPRPLTFPGAGHAFARGRTLRPRSNHQPFSEPPWKQTRFQRGWQKMITLWHTWKRHNWRKRCCCMQEQGHSVQTSWWHCFLAPLCTEVSFIFTE